MVQVPFSPKPGAEFVPKLVLLLRGSPSVLKAQSNIRDKILSLLGDGQDPGKHNFYLPNKDSRNLWTPAIQNRKMENI